MEELGGKSFYKHVLGPFSHGIFFLQFFDKRTNQMKNRKYESLSDIDKIESLIHLRKSLQKMQQKM